MSKEGGCKHCMQGRGNMCRGYRNGNKALRCRCTHSKGSPPRTPPKTFPEHLMRDHLLEMPLYLDAVAKGKMPPYIVVKGQ